MKKRKLIKKLPPKYQLQAKRPQAQSFKVDADKTKPAPTSHYLEQPPKNYDGRISEIVREPTAGGVIFRRGKTGKIELLLIADAKNRWTIPKGHIEPGENPAQTAIREIKEETGIKEIKSYGWLKKIHFRYKRFDKLVLMTTDIYLIKAVGETDRLHPETWINNIAWMPASEALEKIEYDDIGKAIMIALKKIRELGQ